jgi:hypothetical protein
MDTSDKLTDFYNNPPYQRRLVIFYDVLGWQNHIKAANGGAEKIGDLRRLILQSNRSLRLRSQFSMRISTFSDNIVVTQPINEKTSRLLTLIAFQQIAAAMKGFLLKGGITVGDVVHDDERLNWVCRSQDRIDELHGGSVNWLAELEENGNRVISEIEGGHVPPSTQSDDEENGASIAAGPICGPGGGRSPPRPVRQSRDVFGGHRKTLATNADAHHGSIVPHRL